MNSAARGCALFVGLPRAAPQKPNRQCRIMFVTDGYWDFQNIATIPSHPHVYDKYAQNFITVGIGHATEGVSYVVLCAVESSHRSSSARRSKHQTTQKIFSTRSGEILHSAHRRGLAQGSGESPASPHSLNGLPALFSIGTQPDLGNRYITMTPASWRARKNHWLLICEKKFSGRAGKIL